MGCFNFEHSVLAATYSRLATTIGADELNCRVRKENGCTLIAKPPTQKARSLLFVFTKSYTSKVN